MFIKGTVLGIVTKAPVIEHFDTALGENRKKITLTVSSFRKKYREPGYFEDDVIFYSWGEVPGGVDFYALKEGDMVFGEFKIQRNSYITKEGNKAHTTKYYLTGLTRLGTLPEVKLNKFKEVATEEEEPKLYDGTAPTKEQKEDEETCVKMEDIF